MTHLLIAAPVIPRPAVAQISAGWTHTCAIRASDQSLICWGGNEYGQSSVPSTLGQVTVVEASRIHTCAIKTSDQHLVCWGNNDYGQTDVPDDLGAAMDVSAGNWYTCAIKASDHIPRCWGTNDRGQTDIPADLGAVTDIESGNIHTCAIRASDQHVVCWGSNMYEAVTVPPDLGAVSALSVGYQHTCAIRASDQHVVCWGTQGIPDPEPQPDDLGAATAVTVGGHYTCAIKASDQTARCWGYNDNGQTNVPPTLGPVSAISAGAYHTCAIRASDQSVVCWGQNSSGQCDVPPDASLTVEGSPLSESGGMATVWIHLSDFPANTTQVVLSTGGSATRNVDYTLSESSVVFTHEDLVLPVTITGIPDLITEPDETIMIQIASVTSGGIEGGFQQVSLTLLEAIPTDIPTITPTVTPTATDEPGEELLVNGGFEDGLTPWTLKNGTQDKIKCDALRKGLSRSHSGNCAFVFKGGALEQSKLQQTLDLSDRSFTVGDTLDLKVYLNAPARLVSGKINIIVRYSDGTTTGKLSLKFIQTDGYKLFSTRYLLTSSAVSSLKATVKHTSSYGRVRLDDVSLIHNAGDPISARTLPLP